jgi:antitoxin (DNA-binding transcriptional repressor) of toxin-antitoxin stability system
MDIIPIHKAKSTLSQLVKRAAAGEALYIGAYGKAQAVLAPFIPPKSNLRREAFGCLAGKIKIPDDLELPLPQELTDAFYHMQGLEDFEIQ